MIHFRNSYICPENFFYEYKTLFNINCDMNCVDGIIEN